MIPLIDLRAQYANLREAINGKVAGVLASGQYVLGPEVAAFEKEFAAYAGAAHGIATSSGTSALHLALVAAGVRPGDEVITVPFTFVATVAAIEYAGATPVFVDIEDRHYTMDPAQIEAAITPRTKAIVPVHLYGQPADMDAINGIARACGLVVVEDAAQAHGAKYGDRYAGALGDFGCFSFYPTKILGTYGEGGLVMTNDPERAALVRRLRDWGQVGRYNHVDRGFNARMGAMQGAVLRVKLNYLDTWIATRRQLASSYDSQLASMPLQVPEARPGSRHVYYTYTIRSRDRDRIADALRACQIQSDVHYPTPVHLQPAYASLGYRAGDFPQSEQASREVLSLPIYPELSQAQVGTVCDAVHASIQESAANAKS
jgi:dTDP-4-amino-4,6-dideoxygalactose transaminase